jgi:hypothetical protein
MIYHQPSFLYHLSAALDVSFDIYAYNWMLRITPPNRYFTPALCLQYVSEALVRSFEQPLVTLRGPRNVSLFDAPPETYCAALAEALSVSWKYLLQTREIRVEGGERRTQYTLSLKVLQGIVQDVRRSEDVKLSAQMLDGEGVMSHRLLLQKIRHTNGRDIGRRRALDALKGLIELKMGKYNGRMRTAGMEVLEWPNS